MMEKGYEIRAGRRDDAAEAARLWVRSAEEHASYDRIYATAPDAEKTMRRFLTDLASGEITFLFVALSEEEGVIGFASGELREGSPTFHPRTWAAVDDVYVIPEHRSSGVGRSLLEHCQSWAKDHSADGLSLQVAAGNTRARKLYEELGFREVSVYELLEF